MTSAIDPKPMSRSTAVLYAVGSPLFLVALVFAPVGRIDWIPGWIFIVVLVGAFSFAALLMKRLNPIIFRARSRFQPGTKTWDLVLVAVLLPAMVAEIPVATLDAGRMRWSAVPLWVVLLGYALLLGSIVVTTWAQAVNPYFEPGVRIQQERAHQVISSGPYKFVRHPGYSAALVLFIAMPLALGSWWALLPATLASALLVVRTGLEDSLLRAELSGYADYARRTGHRLVPGLW